MVLCCAVFSLAQMLRCSGLYDMGRFFPEAHREFQNFCQLVSVMIAYGYYRRLSGLSSGEAFAAAQHWAAYENSCATLVAEARGAGQGALSISLIEAHYFARNCFRARFILNHVKTISHLPSVIVNGRHDVICPPFSAHSLLINGARMRAFTFG